MKSTRQKTATCKSQVVVYEISQSTCTMSLMNLFRILPVGTLSKKLLIGAWTSLNAIVSDKFLDILTDACSSSSIRRQLKNELANTMHTIIAVNRLTLPGSLYLVDQY